MRSSPPPARKPRTAAASPPGVSSSKSRARADKLSVSLPAEDVRWVTSRAKKLKTSVSAVISSAVADQRRTEARAKLMSMLGEEDITEAQLKATRREAFGK